MKPCMCCRQAQEVLCTWPSSQGGSGHGEGAGARGQAGWRAGSAWERSDLEGWSGGGTMRGGMVPASAEARYPGGTHEEAKQYPGGIQGQIDGRKRSKAVLNTRRPAGHGVGRNRTSVRARGGQHKGLVLLHRCWGGMGGARTLVMLAERVACTPVLSHLAGLEVQPSVGRGQWMLTGVLL